MGTMSPLKCTSRIDPRVAATRTNVPPTSAHHCRPEKTKNQKSRSKKVAIKVIVVPATRLASSIWDGQAHNKMITRVARDKTDHGNQRCRKFRILDGEAVSV